MPTGRATAAPRLPATGRRTRLSPVTVAAMGLAALALGAAGAGFMKLRGRPPVSRTVDVDEVQPAVAGAVPRLPPEMPSTVTAPATPPREATPELQPQSQTATPEVIMPPFGQPEEARRYREAKAAGTGRALALLDRAIAEASRDPRSTGEHLAALRRRRAELVSPPAEPAKLDLQPPGRTTVAGSKAQ